MSPSRRDVVLAWLPALAFMALVWLASTQTGLAHAFYGVPLADKVVHFLEFGFLGFLSARASLRTWPDRAAWRAVLVGALVAAAWGLGDELHQAVVPGRMASAGDLLADVLGALAGALARLALSRTPSTAPHIAPGTSAASTHG